MTHGLLTKMFEIYLPDESSEFSSEFSDNI